MVLIKTNPTEWGFAIAATGGSGTSECSSKAAINACTKLLANLAPFKAKAESWQVRYEGWSLHL